MAAGKLVSATAFLLWSVVSQRVASLVGPELAKDMLGDIRQFLSSQGFAQLAALAEDPATQRRATAVLQQACDLFAQRVTREQRVALQRFTRLPLRTVEELELALAAYTERPHLATLQEVVRATMERLIADDSSDRLHLEDALHLFMASVELALVSQGDFAPLLIRLDALQADVKQLLQPPFSTPIISDDLIVTPEVLIGREPLIEHLIGVLSPANPTSEPVVLLYGPLGAGKSAVAKEVGRRMLASSPGQTARFDAVIIDRFQFHDKAEELYTHFIHYLEAKLGVKTSVDPIEARASRVRNELRQRSLLYIIDEVEHDIAQRVIVFAQTLGLSKAKILITQNTAPRRPECLTLEVTELNNSTLAREFIANRCAGLTLTDAQVDQILEWSHGNLIALEEIARLFQNEAVDVALAHIAEEFSRPGTPGAERWIGYTLRQLTPLERLILDAQCLFQRSAHIHMLLDIVRAHELGEVPERSFRAALKSLNDRSLLRSTNEPERFLLRSTFQNYLRQQLKDEDTLDGWRACWKDQYLKLRRRRDDSDDIPGWTILIDYTPTGHYRVNPSHPDEAATIRDVIQYCTSSNRIDERWEDAARLLDNFRATLFAAGHWQTRIDAERLVIAQAEERQQWHYVAQHKRLLAWMYCFRDEYLLARAEAESAYEIVCERLPRSKRQADRIVHCQTMYKALITLGHVSLREGQDAAIRGHYRRSSDIAYAEQQFLHARDRFTEARSHFENARRYIQHAYPDEALIVRFHLAEVDYYDRHSLTLLGDARIQFERLRVARSRFEAVLKAAKDRQHQRLTALATYYLGKTYRRMATYRSLNIDSTEHFADARRLLEQATAIATEHGDTVLLARLAFAYAQYYESSVPADEEQTTERTTALDKARAYVWQAIAGFESIKMRLEKQDAEHFRDQRLSKPTE